MDWDVVASEQYFDALRAHLLASRHEAAAVLVCGTSSGPDVGRLLVRGVEPVPANGLLYAHGGAISIKPEWLAAVAKGAARDGLTLVVVHSHPFSTTAVAFSTIDTDGQAALIPALQRRLPGRPIGELVFGQASVDGLLWEPGAQQPGPIRRLVVVGRRISTRPTTRAAPGMATGSENAAYARQALIWGEPGQRRLRAATVGVVGSGGNGSWVCAQLIHLGIGRLVVVDHDVVEASNRARVVGSRPEDAAQGVAKVRVVERYAREHNPDVRMTAIQARVESDEALAALKECDILVGCTDTLGSRDGLNQLAVRYLIPLIDTGAEVELEGEQLRTFAVRCTGVLPGGPCLRCAGFVTAAALDSEAAAGRPGYIPGILSPSVAPLNALAASIAVLDCLRLIHGLLGGVAADAFEAYSGRSGELRRCSMASPRCEVCAEWYARGDLDRPSDHGGAGGPED